ncbi:MAG: divergent polysaccharide deacetylase family protein [Paracoccaceae bacterium]
MSRGFAGGVLWGGIVGVLGLGVISQIAPLPPHPEPAVAKALPEDSAPQVEPPAPAKPEAAGTATQTPAPAVAPATPEVAPDQAGSMAPAPADEAPMPPAATVEPEAPAPAENTPATTAEAPMPPAAAIKPEAPAPAESTPATTAEAPPVEAPAIVAPPAAAAVEIDATPDAAAPVRPDPAPRDLVTPQPETAPRAGVAPDDALSPAMGALPPAAPSDDAGPSAVEPPPVPSPVSPQDEALLAPAADAPAPVAPAEIAPVEPEAIAPGQPAEPPVAAADPAVPASEAAPAPKPGLESAALPETLAPDPALPPVTGRLPRIGDAAPESLAPDAAPQAGDDRPPVTLYARHFDNPDKKPAFAILLIDTGGPQLDREKLASLPFPVTFLIDPQAPDAAAAEAIYRAAGQEVAMLATGIPQGATAADLEQTFQANAAVLPEAVAIADLPQGGFQDDRPLASQVVPVVKAQGRGLVTFDRGLNAADQVARREDVPSALIFRRLDGEGEQSPVIRRYLDRAAFKAAQEGRVAVLGETRPDTVAALLEWTVEGRAAQVALAPLTAVMTVQ